MHKLLYIFFLFILLYGIYNNYKSKPKVVEKNEQTINKTDKPTKAMDCKKYIIDVINNGSNSFNFKGGVMEGGYIPKEDASKVACYVLTLSGKSCDFPQDAQMFYSSSCAGCHGQDGKGSNKTYPNLTNKKLLGCK